jgi:uncharacterized damage-inducible protein DinB
MKLTTVILEELEQEGILTRRALERVPEVKNDWKPHPKSMALGPLAHMVATMPSWISMMVKQDDLDIRPKGGSSNGAARNIEASELVGALDKAVEDARQALSNTTDQHLETPWKMLEGGKIVMEKPRYSFILDNFKHLAHHRGQLTVYLRMNEAQVPAIYGPSADDHRF